MKSKKKLLLMGVGVMGALAMGVGATSTFAWYQAGNAANKAGVDTIDQTELTAYLATGKLYTNDTGTTEASATFDGSATYYRRTAVKSVGKYAYKVIRVQ